METAASTIFITPEQRVRMPVLEAIERMPDHLRFGTRDPCTVRLGQAAGRLDSRDLRFAREPASPDGHSPPWLTLRPHPVILPRRWAVRGDDVLVRSRVPRGPLNVYRGELDILNDYPWCTVGKVFVGAGTDLSTPTGFGSGVMVGRNLMLTASHVAPWGARPWWMRFVPAFKDGLEPFGSSYVSEYFGITSSDDDSDYVICRLYDPIGDACGWMGSWGSTDDDFYEDRAWDSVGYPGDFANGQRPCVEWNITPEDADVNGSEVEITFASAFTSPGWSGGPLFGWVNGEPRVVGVTRGTQQTDYWIFGSDDDALFTGGLHMVDLVKHGLANWPV